MLVKSCNCQKYSKFTNQIYQKCANFRYNGNVGQSDAELLAHTVK